MRSRYQIAINIAAILIAGLFLATAAHAERPDFGGSCSSAKVVGVPSDTYGRIGWRGDRDYFKLTVGSAGVLTVYTAGNNIDTEGVLYNSSCGEIAYNDDGGSRYNFKIEHPVSAGTYYVQVRAWEDRSRFRYKFSVNFDGHQNHTITASAGTGGSISPSGDITVGNNGNMTFSISPNSCYEISDVTVDGNSKGVRTSWTFSNVTSDHTIHADFSRSGPFVIDASAQTGGTISPSGNINSNCGSSQSFVIDPNAFYEIFDVLVDGVSVGPVSSYTINNIGENHTIEAKFKEFDKHTIETIAGDGGSISPIGPVQVYDGTSKTFSISPFNGFKIEEVWVNGTSMGVINSYTFENVSADQRIEARFVVDSSGGGGSGCLDISDTPLDVRFQSAPPNIMFVLDDSGSMDWELMTPESNGIFEGRYYYVFDDPGDHVYYPNNDYYILKGEARKKWKTQFWGYNRLFYNSEVTYEPWPGQSNADIVAPHSHPMNATHTLTLADPYLTLTKSTVISDDRDSGFSITGGWDNYTYWGGAINDNAHMSKRSEETKTAKWTPNLQVGTYNVYARWTDSHNISNNVRYEIYSDGNNIDETITVDQRSNGYKWNLLGTYTFFPDGYVKLELDDDEAENETAVADAIKFEPVDNIAISNAHYYAFDDVDEDGALDTGEQVYLINFVDDIGNDGVLDTRKWYEVNDDGDDIIQINELSPISESSVTAVAPELVARSITEDLQNFANWYSFYRRRELSATAAVASVIDMANRMQIGISSINGLVKEPVHKINVDGVDERDSLLIKLYNITLTAQGTPLRRGLQNVGKYFDKTDSGDTGGIGAAPWYDSDNGGACQQAFAIVMTDGYYNGGEPWSSEKDYDGDNGEPYADSWSNTLADVAMYYYENDLVSDDDLKDLVPTTERDSANHQHLVTYGVGFGVTGALNPDDYDENFKHISTGALVSWPDPDTGDLQKIDDLWHASVNGRGLFLSAGDASELVNDLLLVFKDIEYYAGSASSVSVNGDELYAKINNNTMLFQAKYYSETWHGDVLAFRVNPSTGALEKPAVWSAAEQLSHKGASGRFIATSNGQNSGELFRYSNITDPMKQMLDADPVVASRMLDYLRGDASYEVDNGGTFRNRSWLIRDPEHPLNGQSITSSKLSDVVHASPVYKDGALYTGGNDGMLHAFDASTGEELFAYVPFLVFQNLRYLSAPDYTHKYYVDLTPAVADVELGATKQLLVGGLGKGGKGYYALDITSVKPLENSVPSTESEVKRMVMWEYPNLQTPANELLDVGYSFSRVTIAKSHDVGDLKYMVLFGNGYNSDNGSAALMILDPETGQLVKKIDTGATGCNGLSTPMAVDVDFDHIVDYVYAGDLRGNLWKFDLTASDYNLWDVAYHESGLPKPLFSTSGGSVQPITTRPDVMFHCSQDGYMVFFGTGKYLEEADLTDQSQQSVYAIWDFGDDVDDTEYVGDWDHTYEILTNSNLLSGVTLQDQDIAEYTDGNKQVRVTTENSLDWTPTTLDSGGFNCGFGIGESKCDRSYPGDKAEPTAHAAWFMNLSAGERIVSDLIVRDGKLLIISYIPEGSMCGTGGKSWVMAVNACSGARLGSVMFDKDEDGKIEDKDGTDGDRTNTGSNGNDQWDVPSGIEFDGHLQPPAIIIFGDTEVLYMSSSTGNIERLRQKSARLGMVYWRIFRP